MIRRIGVLAGAALATLVFAASANAATTPQLKPIPPFVCGPSVTASWTPSTPMLFGTIVAYRLDIGDLTAGTATYKYVPPSSTSTTIGGLINGHHYVVRLRALEYRLGSLYYSGTSARTFMRACLAIPVERLKQYVAYNPWPECIMCGRLEELPIEDPVLERQVAAAKLPAADEFRGLQLEADGSVLVM